MQLGMTFFVLYSMICFLLSSYHTRKKNNYFGLTPWFVPLGSFVWADGVMLGLFWTATSIALLITANWPLAILVYSLFWTVRSSGEIIYWIHEQFATKKRNLPHTLFLYRLFPNESVWIGMQLLWQLVLVISLTADIFLIKQIRI